MLKEVALNNIRSAHNVGSIMRTCDVAGIGKLYLCGYTPTPVDRFGRKRRDIAKVALGAESSLSWEKEGNILDLIETKKEAGFSVVGVEQSPRSKDYRKLRPNRDTLYVFGNETEGLDDDILRACSSVVEIPMRGDKESLNVSVAVGIILFEATD